MRDRKAVFQLALALLLHAGALVVSVAVPAGLVVLNVALWRADRFSISLFVLTAIAVVVLISATLLSVFVPAIDPRLRGLAPVDRQTFAKLVGYIDNVAATVAAPSPDDIYIVTDAVVFVRHETRFAGLRSKRRMLAIGLPCLTGLTTDDLAVISARELAHFTGLSRAGSVADRTTGFIDLVVGYTGDTLDRRRWMRIWSLPMQAYGLFFRWASAAMLRQRDAFTLQRVEALYGPERSHHADAAMADLTARHLKAHRVFVKPAWTARRAPDNIFELTRRVLLTEAERSVSDASNKSATATDRGGGTATTTATELLDNVGDLESTLSAHVHLIENGEQRFDPIAAADIGKTVLGARVKTDVDAMCERTSNGRRSGDGREQLVALMLTGDRAEYARALGGPVMAYLYRQRGDLDLLRDGTRKVLADLLVREGGCRWQTDWTDGVGVVDSRGDAVDLDAFTRDVLDSPEAASAWFERYALRLP